MKNVILPLLLFSNTVIADELSIASLIKELNWTQEDIQLRGEKEIASFLKSQVWEGGYFEGDPLEMYGGSSYYRFFDYNGILVNPLYIIYHECLVPFIDSSKTVLEIGSGRGAWSKPINGLSPHKLICLDALPAQYNQFWEHVGYSERVIYHQVFDYSCKELTDDSIDYVFSFGVLCHISPIMINEYFKNLYSKLKKGAQGCVMYADFDKKSAYAKKYEDEGQHFEKFDEVQAYLCEPPSPSWYHLGIKRANDILSDLGYEVLSADIEVNERDPIIHFKKPEY